MRSTPAISHPTHLFWRRRRLRIRPGSPADWALQVIALLMGMVAAVGLVGLLALLASLAGRG